MRRSTALALALGAPLVALGPGLASAGSLVGQSAPFAGFGADDGTELFTPTEEILALEVRDLSEWLPGYTSTLGFYSASDPSTLVPLFEASDELRSGRQVAVIDFESGRVVDADAYLDGGVLKADSLFNAGTSSIGFYLTIADSSGAEFTVYTQPTLNTLVGGADVFASFPGSKSSGKYLLGAEISTPLGVLTLRVDMLSGLSPSSAVSPMPEPASQVLFVTGLLIVGVALRARRASSTPG